MQDTFELAQIEVCGCAGPASVDDDVRCPAARCFTGVAEAADQVTQIVAVNLHVQ
jgi:hypothetical protein